MNVGKPRIIELTWQTGHWNGLSRLCIRRWFLMFPLVRKRRLQWGQAYFFRANLDDGFVFLGASFLRAATETGGTVNERGSSGCFDL